MNEKYYCIYVQDKCVYKDLNEQDFQQTWHTLNHVVELIGNYKKEDLSFLEHTS